MALESSSARKKLDGAAETRDWQESMISLGEIDRAIAIRTKIFLWGAQIFALPAKVDCRADTTSQIVLVWQIGDFEGFDFR
jgi:hypothetical protein